MVLCALVPSLFVRLNLPSVCNQFLTSACVTMNFHKV